MSDDRQTNDSKDQKSMKVTDRRMFTPEGELREEYRHLEEARTSDAEPEDANAAAAEPEPPPEPEPEPEPSEPGQPAFYDLVTLLAENASVYLRHSGAPGPEGAQHREMAKLHIDLLAVLKQKTSGNLDREEQAMLDEILYRLRLAFSSQRGF